MADLEPFIATVCWYGRRTVDDRMIPHGAITVAQLPLPVLAIANAGYGLSAIGKIEAIEDGWDEGYSTMVVLGEADRSALPRDDNGDPFYGVGMDLVPAEFVQRVGLFEITSARLIAISVIMNPAFPKAKMTFPGDAP